MTRLAVAGWLAASLLGVSVTAAAAPASASGDPTPEDGQASGEKEGDPAATGGATAKDGPDDAARVAPARGEGDEADEGETARGKSDEADEGEPSWSDFELEGAHGFIGIAVGPALMGDWYFGDPPTWQPGMLVAIRGGALFDHIELAAELAPVSMWRAFSDKSLFSFNVTIGGQLELAPNVYWPLRFGLGVTAVNLPHDSAAMQARLDLIGIIYQAGHVEIEVDLLSARFSSEFQHYGLWSAPFTVAGSYVF